MMQTGSLTPTALGWVREDLDREIERVRAQVETIADNPNAGAVVIEGAVERLEELDGIFETLVMDGPRQVTGEMRRLIASMENGQADNREAIGSALLEAMVVLPAYLDRVQAGHPDLPLLLLPLINQMRASAGEEPLSGGQVFTPSLDVELPELETVQKPGFDEPFSYLTERLHRQYEKSLENWLDEPDDASLLSPLQGICETLRHRVEAYDLKRLWWVATELFGGLMDGHVEDDTSLRRLIAGLADLIQVMSEQGEEGIDDRTCTATTQALLFHIGNAKPGSEGVDLIRERFGLGNLALNSETMMRARGALSGADRDTYESLSAAVEDELATIKDALDLELRTGEVKPERRKQSVEALSRLADTLSMLGLSTRGSQIAELITRFEACADADEAARDATLEHVAEQLLLVESALQERVETLGEAQGDEQARTTHTALSDHEQRRIVARLLDECVTSMHVAQDAVRERFAGKAAADPAEALALIVGALHMAEENATAALTERLADTLARYFHEARDGLEIEQEDMETIADAMAALELYLSACRDRQNNAGHLVELVEERLGRIDARLAPAAPEQEAPTPAAGEPAQLEAVSDIETSPAPDMTGDEDRAEPDPALSIAPASPVEEPQDAPAEEQLAEAMSAEAAETTAEPAEATRETPAEPAPQPAPAPAPEPGGTASAAEPEDELPSEIDPELREIFLEEYEEVLQTLQASIPAWVNQLDNADALTEIRRAFHTLKGSGRMVGADELGDFSWQIENMLNTLLEGRSDNFGDASVMVRLAEASLPALRQRLLQETTGLTGDVIVAIGQIAETVSLNEPADWGSLQPRLPVYLAGLLPSDVGSAPAAAPASSAAAAPTADRELDDMLEAELTEHLAPLRDLMDAIAQNRETRASNEQVRAAHTIAGALAMQPEGLDAEIAQALEGLLEAQSRSGRPFTPDVMFTVIGAVGQLQNRLERIGGVGDLSPAEEQQELVQQLEHLRPQFEGPDTTSTGTSDLTAPEEAAAGTTTDEPSAPKPPTRADHAPEPQRGEFDPGRSVFAGAADGAAEETEDGLVFEPVQAPEEPATPLRPEAEASGDAGLEAGLERALDGGEDTDDEAADALDGDARALAELEATELGTADSRAPVSEPEADSDDGEPDAGQAEAGAAPKPSPSGVPDTAPPREQTAGAAPELPAEAEATSPEVAEDTASTESLDQEIVEIFLEEATEVLERGESALDQWHDDLEQVACVQELQREIHTFKGGARMAGLSSIGDFAHEMEDLLERIADGVEPPTLSAVQVLEEACDRLTGWVEEVRQGRIPDADQALALLKQQIEGLGDVAVAPGAPQAAPSAEAGHREIRALEEPSDTGAESLLEEPADEAIPTAEASGEAAAPATPAPAARDAAQDVDDPASGGTIKVAAELLDRLVNASGEVSIYRSRLEQQLGKLKSNVAEFDETIKRLSEQFRKMDIEIEAQIRANYPDAVQGQGESFDPLELDQFSALQQATRSLQESVADLLSLQEMAEENVRASEQLLTRQSRVSTELQEGLMKTRMVPFATIAPRLRAIVRRACREEGKQARLQLRMVGSSDELDRNVLDHITTPLEHMMRNAVAHGIEKPEGRRERGKAAEGEITITVESEATEFVIRIADDGGGIKLDAIRERAVERGLLDEHAEPSRQQLYAFMMDSGFSTSSAVTQLAGRGVGMDVVNSDIKQIGGSLEIDSEPGQGTQFTIRIPFTLAIMQAIGLEAGEARYLMPLSAVVGVSRVLPDDYRKLLEEDSPVYRFAGQEYPVLDIEPLLGERPTPLGKDNVSLLILSAGEQKAAVRVPQLLPHREVVIKPVGPQIGSVAGVLGGSISGDGEVMVILDPGPLIRRALIHGVQALDEAAYAPPVSNKRLVLVVDDSITMRKVTSRVLENRDYEVITARDGIDALEQLQDRTPDIMLFDIEMPRMDGYELTERVRDDGRFRQTPIMMITSRAGQKHRDRAMQAGATAYLTKPYREDELLAEVERLLDEAKH